MIKLLFMLPVGLCFLWFLYLKHNGYTLKQGKQGFLYILIISAVIALFYTLMLWLTHR
ncbi:hypothetical protein [Aestuariibacter salexigens]|uniref:hypothetical protein n=1 Tax=Aestuariibacter salexigens TaxID=226010 RepID=UPI00042A4220|nr:hypothetical protein [Aestuariibacter salexigens]